MTPVHLVTGAGSGIGAALAAALRDRGDRLVLLVRSQERREELGREFPEADFVVADLADPAGLADLRLPDRLDSLVHAAGVVDLGEVAVATHDHWRHHLDVNLVAPALVTAAALPALRATRGTVVFVSSTSGLSASAGWSAYAASKHGLKALADSLRAEEADNGVRVSSIHPSRTATPMQERVHGQEGKDYDESMWIQPQTVADAIRHVLDLPRDATIPDLVLRPGPAR